MANFFSLGSGSGGGGGDQTPHQHQHQHQHQYQSPPNNNNNNNPNNWAATSSSHPGLVVYRNEEIYQKGFEIWQQYVQVHHHHTHPFLPGGLYLGDQMPNAATAPRSTNSSGSRVMMRGSASGSGAINCQDCGNQAKKDCSHMRCRTCCKSRGFHCSTHVKSTWVPAAKRRERQHQHQHQHPPEIGMIREKRPREDLANDHTNSSRMATSTSGSGNLGLEMPGEIRSAAVFRCVRVQSVEKAEEQLAYQTAVKIGGHMFKGLLYDQGPDAHYPLPGVGVGVGVGDQNLLLLNSSASSSGAAVDPNGVYPPPMNAFLAGTQFFPPPRS